MRLQRDNLFVRLLGATDDERGWVKRVLNYDIRGAGSRYGGQPFAVYDVMNDRFPAGLLPDIGRAAQRDEVALEVVDLRAPMPTPSGVVPRWLDASQLEAMEASIKFGRGILQHATGAGKTELFVAMAGVVWPTEPALFLAPRAQLAIQARERWALRASEGHVPAEETGLLAEGEKTVRRVTFGTFQTVHAGLTAGVPACLALLERVVLLAGDECHTAAADTFFPVLMGTPRARLRFGLSATPLQRHDERGVLTLGAFGPVIHKVSAPDLVTTGRLVAPVIEMHALKQIAMRAHPRDTAPGRVCTGCPAIDDEPCADDCATMDPRSGIFQRVYRELVVESTPRNELLVQLIAQAPKPALVFVKNLDHAKYLAAMLARAVGSVRVVNGSKSTAQRERVVQELQRHELDVAVATSVWEAGVDIPELRTVVNAGAGASSIRSVQMLGRGLRGAEGKDAALMIDILDQGEPSLERHARQRRKAYKAEGFEVVER